MLQFLKESVRGKKKWCTSNLIFFNSSTNLVIFGSISGDLLAPDPH